MKILKSPNKKLDKIMEKALRSRGISMDAAFTKHQIGKEKVAANHVMRFDLGIRDPKKIKAVWES